MLKNMTYFNAAMVFAGGAIGLFLAGMLKKYFDSHPIEDPLEVTYRNS